MSIYAYSNIRLVSSTYVFEQHIWCFWFCVASLRSQQYLKFHQNLPMFFLFLRFWSNIYSCAIFDVCQGTINMFPYLHLWRSLWILPSKIDIMTTKNGKLETILVGKERNLLQYVLKSLARTLHRVVVVFMWNSGQEFWKRPIWWHHHFSTAAVCIGGSIPSVGIRII